MKHVKVRSDVNQVLIKVKGGAINRQRLLQPSYPDFCSCWCCGFGSKLMANPQSDRR